MRDAIEKSAEGEAVRPTQTLTHDTMLEPAGGGSALDTQQTRQAEVETRIATPFRDALRRFLRNWAAVASLTVLVLLILAAIFAHFLRTSDPSALDYLAINSGPSPAHWFGTDPEGRDEYTRILFGLRIPFLIGFVGTAITLIVGLLLGLLAGYYGSAVDSLVSRFTDFMFAFPALLLSIIAVTLFGGAFDNALPNGFGRALLLTIVFAFVSWPPLMRFVRSLALSLKEQQFVEAARTVGTSNWKIVTRHLVPNVWGLVLVQASFLIVGIIYNEAVLSILGLGVTQPTPDLGSMLYDGAQYMDANGWGAFFPSLFLTIIIVAFTFLGDGIRDAVDPRGQQ